MNNIQIIKGTSKNLILTFKKDGVIQDLTGYTVYFTIKKRYGLSDSEGFVKTITDHNDAVNGITIVELTTEDTESLDVNTYFYEIEISKDDERVVTNKGEVNVEEKLKD